MSEAANPEGADARSPEAERLEVIKILLSESCPCDEDEVCDCPQGRALAAMGICGLLRHGSCTLPLGHKGPHNHWALIPRDAQRPSGSPSVPAAQPLVTPQGEHPETCPVPGSHTRTSCNYFREQLARYGRHLPGCTIGPRDCTCGLLQALDARPLASTDSVPAAQPQDYDPIVAPIPEGDWMGPHGALPKEGQGAAAQAVEHRGGWRCRCRALLLPMGVVALQDLTGTVHAAEMCTATGVEWDAAGKPICPPGVEHVSGEPRAAPTPALPREAPEPGGTLAGLLADLREARESNKALTAAGLKLAEQLHEARRGTAPSSPESPAVAANAGDRNHE